MSLSWEDLPLTGMKIQTSKVTFWTMWHVIVSVEVTETAERKTTKANCNTPPPPFRQYRCFMLLHLWQLQSISRTHFFHSCSQQITGQPSKTMTVEYMSEKTLDTSCKNYWPDRPVDQRNFEPCRRWDSNCPKETSSYLIFQDINWMFPTLTLQDIN